MLQITWLKKKNITTAKFCTNSSNLSNQLMNRLGSVTLQQLALLGLGDPNFPSNIHNFFIGPMKLTTYTSVKYFTVIKTDKRLLVE